MEKSININIGGDFVLTNEVHKNIRIGQELKELFDEADLNILNLECPVTNSSQKAEKTGPHLKGSENAISRILHKLNVGLVTLANNHVMDFGEKGLHDTIEFCDREGVAQIGAGATLTDASKVYRVNIKGKKIAVLNFAQNEWSIAEEDRAGANPIDLIDNSRQIREEKNISDVIIVIIHAGHEYYNLPSPDMVKRNRFYAECGASIVIGHHSHCISGHEIHCGVPIVYGLGNFLFTEQSRFDDWYTGLVLKLTISNFQSLGFELIPVGQAKENYDLTLLQNDERFAVLGRVERYGFVIANEKLLKSNWEGFLDKKAKKYFQVLSVAGVFKNRYIKGLVSKLNLSKYLFNKRMLKSWLNIMRCEAHSEASQGIIKKYLANGR